MGVRLRAHHLICIGFFEGRGYSGEFTRHMARVIARVEEGAPVTIAQGADDICAECPNNICGVCADDDKSSAYDARTLALLGIAPGETMPFGELARAVRERIILPGRRKEVCGGCEWNAVCEKAERERIKVITE